MPRTQQSTTMNKSAQQVGSKPTAAGSGSPSKFSFDWRKLLPSRVDRGPGANDKPKMSSGILRMLLGFLVFLVVARLIEIGLLWADASYHLGLEKYVTSQKNAFLIGGMTWFALLYFVAIMVGLTTSALVAGNTVVLKPASTAALVAARFVELLSDAGLPDGVLNFLPGPGGTIGDALVEHPLTRFVSFTGSREVGLHINEVASKHREGQRWIKRVALEMGGKDAIVVDETADLDAAASAIVASAFGFQGQKCSACSRAIIVNSVYDTVLGKVVELASRLTVGDTAHQNNSIGAVIDETAFSKILDYIEVGKTEGSLVLGGTRAGNEGYFINPTIFSEVSSRARIAQEEIFGPVLACIRARDFSHAIEIANATEYGLTGSLFSTDRDRIREANERFHVGNLYINRKCTGALVGVHPFGGFNMSGTDSKAGGRDYLLLFTQAKVISEKVS